MPFETAKEFASAAANIGLLADQMKPDATGRHFEIRNVIIYHLRSAASKMRAVAEDLAKTEAQG
jgi:hypothetical protein